MLTMARTEEHSPNWGGARANSGRPRVAGEELIRTNVSITRSQRLFLSETYGERGTSKGVRDLIDIDRLARIYGIDLSELIQTAIDSAEDI